MRLRVWEPRMTFSAQEAAQAEEEQLPALTLHWCRQQASPSQGPARGSSRGKLRGKRQTA